MVRNILIVFAGIINVFAFSPFNLWWMSIVSLSLLLALIHQENYRRGFIVGYLYGLGMFGAGTSWVFNSLYDYGEASLIVAAAMTFVSTLVLSVFPALVIEVSKRLQWQKLNALLRVLTFASLWVLFEWLRSWVLTGFPWLLLGHTLVDSPLAGIVPILGVFGGSALIAVLAASVFETLKSNHVIKWIVGMGVVVVVTYCLGLIQWTAHATENPIKVAAVQANIPFETKWDKSRRNDIYQLYIDLTQAHWDSQIVVWPETAIPTYYMVANKNFIPTFEKELKENDTELLSGIFTYEPGSERIFNSLVTLGGELQIYNKKHLVPFGEYLPMRWLFEFFRALVTIPMSDMSPGVGSSVMQLKGIPIGVSICYEAAFGEEILHALPEAQLLINVTNDAWFGNSLAPHQHLQIARVRALETGRYMIRAANTGVSAIIDSKGSVMSQSGQFVEEVVTGEIWPMHGTTPFIIWGNWAIICIISTLLLLVFVQARRANSE